MPTDSHAVFLSTAAPVIGVTELHIGHVFLLAGKILPRAGCTSRPPVHVRRTRKEKKQET
ncbi:uncharacterized protein BO87DRAFT_379780 [Aspergillus neoniger CBS 115656]|uniref:Uncharacterized protein n=1 Tax=Aspergillus neoniger (strain CBS 115656) TaxID=1448310 RepID=A0A318Y965_ASPNB|nr:hypothetical protein BO87DRAFT_379780 [Aspergillus neoniger CBS 115656]PYH30499.1 hypothetical protein BO87DRAFT_379780 [Aspergillus neoniger CBS 115656]